jgi:hypothetical protein
MPGVFDMTLEELKKIRTILSAATGLEDEDQEIIGAALKAIDALIKPRTTKPAAQPAVPLTDDQVDAATKAWFENDIVAGRYPFGKRMRAAFAAAHGITEKGQQ